jgi:hypothetical protein
MRGKVPPRPILRMLIDREQRSLNSTFFGDTTKVLTVSGRASDLWEIFSWSCGWAAEGWCGGAPTRSTYALPLCTLGHPVAIGGSRGEASSTNVHNRVGCGHADGGGRPVGIPPVWAHSECVQLIETAPAWSGQLNCHSLISPMLTHYEVFCSSVYPHLYTKIMW